MPKFEFCLPITGKAILAGADWFHEVKYVSYGGCAASATVGPCGYSLAGAS
jgi:hypothetical protein